MAHNTSHRRNLAVPDPLSPMDPTTATVNNHRRRHHYPPPPLTHPASDPISAHPPTTTTTTTTIQNISHRFSKLYLNHKKLVTNSSKHPHPHPEPETHSFQTKNPSFSDSSCTTLTKSSSHHERNTTLNPAAAKIADKDHYLSSKIKVKEKDGFKKPISKKDPEKRSSFDECDVKKASQLMSESFEKEEEVVKIVGRSSVSSIPPMVNGGRRRSFCSSQVELADFFSATGVKVVAVDMPPFMQIHAVDCARKAHDSLEKFTSKTLAFTLKKEFDGIYGPAWHCIVGTSFGSFVTHSVGGFMYFSMDHKIYILLFKTTVQRAQE